MTGIELIAAERQRQIEQEGWTEQHDDEHKHGELSDAAVCYATQARWFSLGKQVCPPYWPVTWDKYYWKPSGNRIRDLIKAGALIAAEIDRLQRASTEKEE